MTTFYISPITIPYPRNPIINLEINKNHHIKSAANKNYTAKKGIKNILVSNYINEFVKYSISNLRAYPIHFHKRKDLYAVRKFFNNSGNNKRHKNELKAKNLNTKFQNKNNVNG